MTKKKLPIGKQSFRHIRTRGYYYVDKTEYIRELLDSGEHYLLSRPRRFGKSLLINTLKELFEGNEELFRGLHVHDHWDWSVRHPVIRMSFGLGRFKEPAFVHKRAMAQLDAVERSAGVSSTYTDAPERLSHLVELLHRQAGQGVAILVDEYDKPILDALETPDVARANRDYLRDLYAVIKECDDLLRFAFITGVSKFSKVNLFSGLNNLNDITIDSRYSAICGYTEDDLERVFAPELQGLDREQIRDWYNGYNWTGTERVYNPFDILLLFDKRKFAAYWFETATPTFLVRTLVDRQVSSPRLEGITASNELLSTFDVEDIATEALLFQAGYLTIQSWEDFGSMQFFRLGFPNREVFASLNNSLLTYLVRNAERKAKNCIRLMKVLRENDFESLAVLIRSFFAKIPYEWYTNNTISNYEGYYASIFYSYFAALGLDVTPEESSNLGRLDMSLRFNGNVYLFEFKVVEMEPEGAALQQLKEKRYAEKHLGSGQPVYLVGVEFSKDERNVISFEVDQVQGPTSTGTL